MARTTGALATGGTGESEVSQAQPGFVGGQKNKKIKKIYKGLSFNTLNRNENETIIFIRCVDALYFFATRQSGQISVQLE